MVDAACGAIRRAAGIDAVLTDYHVAATTGGIDALGDVTVKVEVEGRRYTGRGVSTDVVEASARAFCSALARSVRLAGSRPASDRVVTP
jgi:2-isopropylmalate synthase